MIHLSAKKGANPSNWIFYRCLVMVNEDSNNTLVSHFESKPRELLRMLALFEKSSKRPKWYESRTLQEQNLMVKTAELSQFGSSKTLPYRNAHSVDWFYLWNFLDPTESAIISAWTGSVVGNSAERWFPFKYEKVNLKETLEEETARENEEEWLFNACKLEIWESTHQDMACALFLTAADIHEEIYSIFVLDLNLRKKYLIPCSNFCEFIT